MAKVKMVLSWWIPISLITVALMVPTIAGAAGVIKIWPDQLKPKEPNREYHQNIEIACNNIFYTPLTLPPGATIAKITYYHRGMASPAQTWFYIYRVKMGHIAETLGSGSSADSTTVIIPVDVSVTGDPIIRKGYRYMIQVGSDYDASLIQGVKIDYQE